MMGASVNNDSHNIMHLIKEGTVGAEVGVWKGSSTKQFLKKKPAMLHLVDPYACSGYNEAIEANDPTFDQEVWLNKKKYTRLTKGNTVEDFDNYYDKVASIIADQYGSLPNVTFSRMPATEWFAKFDEPFLDWIYLDGDHSYTGAYNDLCGALKVVKKGGIIIGDDYGWGMEGEWRGGVKKAVDQWVAENNLTLEQFGKFQFVARV